MRAVLLALGSRGDVEPVVDLGQKLKARHHEVFVVTMGNFRQSVEEAGLNYRELWGSQAYDVLTHAFSHGPITATGPVPEDVRPFISSLPERCFQVCREICREAKTVLVALEGFATGTAQVIADVLRVPYVSLWINAEQFLALQNLRHAGPLLGELLIRRLGVANELEPAISHFRESQGLPPLTSLFETVLRPHDFSLCLFPGWFLGRFRPTGRDILYGGFPLQTDPLATLPAEVAAFLDSGEPPIVFSNASWRRDLDTYFEASARICEALGRRGIFVSSSFDDDARENSDILRLEYAPFDLLLPRAAALVHHGGIGSAARAMASGIPQLIVPWGIDQPFNAAMVRRLGVGSSSAPEQYPRRGAAKLRDLLASPRVRERCQAVATRLQAPFEIDEACERIERLVRDPRPASPSKPGE